MTEQTSEAVQPSETESEPPIATAARRRPVSRRTKIALAVILVVALVATGGLVGSWAVNDSLYVSTDNAQIDGVQLLVNAPASGTLVDWSVDLGSTLTAGQDVGRIAVQAGYMQPQVTVRSPADGTIAVNNGVNGAFVTAGTQLAIAYDPSAVFVTARVDETKINDVHLGQVVDIAVDAFSGKPLTGRVVGIKTGAAGVFSLFGQSNTTGNFQKVTQVIPVKIAIDDRSGLDLVPGMNVTAKIHRS
ncbi:MAG TPA: HlyD family efflux transporter periplasmic adaptor subunit [Propionibacteriaceae bacterium]